MSWDVLAIDPGRTSGIVVSDGPRYYQVLQTSEFQAMDVIERVKPERIIMEKFVIQKRPDIDAFPLELIGCLHRYSMKSGISLYEHMPSDIKGVQDQMLKDCALWVPNYPHGMDAMKHLVYYYLTQAPMDDRYDFLRVVKKVDSADVSTGGFTHWWRDEV